MGGISRDHQHKRRATGGKRKPIRKKRKFELGRPAANTKLGPQRIHTVRVRGGNRRYRALLLDQGNFSWDLNVVPARPASLMSSTMHQTTSWSAPRLWSRMLLWLLMLPPSDSGMKATMPCP